MTRDRSTVAAASCALLAFAAAGAALSPSAPGVTSSTPADWTVSGGVGSASAGAAGAGCVECGAQLPGLPVALPGDAGVAVLLVLFAVALAAVRSGATGTAAGASPEGARQRAEASAARRARTDPGPPPENPVYRAWAAMARVAGAPASATPGEVADAAVAAGVDPETATELTRLFGAVRYGDRPVTERHRSRAADLRRRVEGEQ